MHIPDGYLSPHTYIPLIGAFVAATAIKTHSHYVFHKH